MKRVNYASPFRKSRTPKWVKEALGRQKESAAIKAATEKLKAAHLRDAKTTGRVNPKGATVGKVVRLKNFTGTVRLNPNKTVSVVGRKTKAAKKR